MHIENVLSALADPTRLRILQLLGQLELAVGELAQALGQSQPRVSRHVAILCDSGLAERRREGSWVFVRRTASRSSPQPVSHAVAMLLEAAEVQDDEFSARCADDRRHLAAIRSVRAKSAEDFFASHAKEWDRLRSLLSPAADVEAALLKALGNRPVGRLLDIGTGTGRIAELLAEQSDHVVGLDRSPEMLRLARARLQSLPPQRWELVHGDFTALPFSADSFDTVVLHQVLHYAQEPAYALKEAARVCRTGGTLAIVDLAAHDREELRESHAHVRLGFSDEQMRDWLEQSGFTASQPVILPGKGLTIKIWIASRVQGEWAGDQTESLISG